VRDVVFRVECLHLNVGLIPIDFKNVLQFAGLVARRRVNACVAFGVIACVLMNQR